MDRSLGLAICSATTTCPLWNCRWCAPGPIFGGGPGVSGGLFGMAVSHPLDPGALTKIPAWKGGDVCQGKRGCKENDKRAADCCFRAIETKRTRLFPKSAPFPPDNPDAWTKPFMGLQGGQGNVSGASVQDTQSKHTKVHSQHTDSFEQMQSPSLFPLLFETTLRMHCIYSRQLEFGTMSQSPNGLNTFWSHRLPKATFTCPFSLRHLDHTHHFLLFPSGKTIRCGAPLSGSHPSIFLCLPTYLQGVSKALSPDCCHVVCLGVGQAALRSCPPHSHHLPRAPNPLRFPQHQERAADGYIVKFSHASSIAASLMGHPSPTFPTACLAQPLHSPR